VYFLVPLRISTVLIGKKLAAAFFVLLEISTWRWFCVLLRLQLRLRILEAISVTLVITTFLAS